MSIHSVTRAQYHLAWDNSIPPILRIKSGEEVEFDCLDASNGQVTQQSTVNTIKSLVLDQLDQVAGPIYVEGAEPGDVLQVEIISIETAEWGWTAIIPDFGLLADEFEDAALKIWAINKEQGFAWFDEVKGIKIPVRPFPGELGIARGIKGAFSTIPPYNTGGNLDTRYLTQGTTVYLPIEASGALFSIGDGHAAQGDGEVCGTAIETPIKIKVRLTVLKDEKKKDYVKSPHFQTRVPPAAFAPFQTGDEYYCTTGVGSDMREATKDAVRSMIKHLEATHGLTRIQAYMLCSVAGELKLHEVVDMPNYVIGMMMPQSIFGHKA